jgi:pimeloyl-ACP methyl ester carboxylesterase
VIEVEVDGAPVAAHTGGGPPPGPGRLVLLLHGSANDHTVWRFQTRLLAGRGVPVLAVDLPGHGRSAGPPRRTVEDLGAWVVALLDAVGATEAAVAGHSLGSLVALAAAALDVGRTRTVALVGTAAPMPVTPALQAAADARSPEAVDLMVGWSHTGRSRFGGHPQPGLWTAGATRRLYERDLAVLGTDLAACDAHDPLPGARALAGRVDGVVVSGAQDRMTRAAAAAPLAEALAVPHVVVPGGSHVSLYDHPAEVNAALLPVLLPFAGPRPA